MKNTILFLLLIPFASLQARPLFDVDKDVLRSFNILFPKATDVKWIEEEANYVANFVNEGIQSRLVYDRQTRRMKLTRYYTGEHLPYSLSLQIKEKFPKVVITGVTEVSSVIRQGKLLNTEYFLVLEQENRLMNIWVRRNGKIARVSNYKKQG